jgi:hypothetical protein
VAMMPPLGAAMIQRRRSSMRAWIAVVVGALAVGLIARVFGVL